MKAELTSLDLSYLVKELKALEGAKLDKVYEQEEDKKDFLFIFHRPGSPKTMLRIKLPSLAYVTDYKSTFPEKPPGFCTFLRKYLTNARIREIRQKGFERILEIVFDTKEDDKTLVCELFSTGNMVLLDKDSKIKGLLESQNWESRTIRGGTKYQYPPMQTETQKISFADYEKIVTHSAFDSIVKTFAIELGLGGFYAEELCKRSNIPKDKKRLSPDELSVSHRQLIGMFRMTAEANTSGGEILPFRTALEPEKFYSSFSAALDENLTEKLEAAKGHKEEKEKKSKQNKITLVIEKQEERLAALNTEIGESQRKGELIYEHYQQVKELLDAFNVDRKKLSWEEMKKKYPELQIDEKKGLITMELE